MEIEENEKALLEGNDSEPISYEWMFRITKDQYQEQEGAPIVRIMGQLGLIGRVIYHELEQGVRNTEGIWAWLVGKRNDFKASVGLTNREIYSYFAYCSIVKNHELAGVIKRHCRTIKFMCDLEEPLRDTPHAEPPNILKRERAAVGGGPFKLGCNWGDIWECGRLRRFSNIAYIRKDSMLSMDYG